METKLLLDMSHQQMNLPVLRLSCSQLSSWPTESHGNSKTSQTIAKAVGGSPETGSKALWLQLASPIQLTEHGKVELMPAQGCHPCGLVFTVQEGILHAAKGKVNTNTVAYPLIYNGDLPEIYTGK